MVFYETVILNLCAVLLTMIVAFVLAKSLSGYPIALLSENLVVIFGGPYARLVFDIHSIMLTASFVFGASLIAAWNSLFLYLRREVRSISAEGL